MVVVAASEYRWIVLVFALWAKGEGVDGLLDWRGHFELVLSRRHEGLLA